MENLDLNKIKPQSLEGGVQTELSKKLQNKLVELLKISGIDKTVAINIFKCVRITEYDIYTQAEVNIYTPEILSSLVSKEFGYISLDTHDLTEVTRIITEKIAKKESFEDFTISLGFGGSVNIPNVRVPAYIVPAIKTLESMHKLAENKKIKGIPRVKIFKAENMASLVNGFDLDRMHKVTELTFDFLKAFVSKFYPHLSSNFYFSVDKEPSSDFLNELQKQSEFLRNYENIKDIIVNLMKIGEKHGGEEGKRNALLYASAHPYYNQSIVDKRLQSLVEGNSAEIPAVIIDHGGRPQDTFNKISRVLIDKSREESNYITPPILHMLIKTGKIPVYYTARDGDLSLDQNFSDIDFNKLDKSTHKDYEEIFSLVSREKFLQFVINFKKEHKQKIKDLNYEK